MVVKRNRTPQSSINSKQSSNSFLPSIFSVITVVVWFIAMYLSLSHHDKIGYHLAACCCPYLYIIYFIFIFKKHK